jgi:hypothetical protein
MIEKREARIILPAPHKGLEPKQAQEWANVHGRVMAVLTETFGGATVYDAEGIWKDPSDGAFVREIVRIYDVAIHSHQAPMLETIALDAGKELGQKTVYVRDHSGRVRILEVHKPQRKAA